IADVDLSANQLRGRDGRHHFERQVQALLMIEAESVRGPERGKLDIGAVADPDGLEIISGRLMQASRGEQRDADRPEAKAGRNPAPRDRPGLSSALRLRFARATTRLQGRLDRRRSCRFHGRRLQLLSSSGPVSIAAETRPLLPKSAFWAP